MHPKLTATLREVAPDARVLDATEVQSAEAFYAANKAQLGPQRTLRERKIGDDNDEVVRIWFRGLNIDPATPIDAVWLFDHTGARLTWGELVAGYNLLWRPAADDLWVSDLTRSWFVLLHHEEIVLFGKSSGPL